MKFPKQALVATSMLVAVTAFAQVSRPSAPAVPQPSVGTAITQQSSAGAGTPAASATARERSAVSERDAKAEADAKARVDASKKALAPSAGVGARMETDMSQRR